MVAFGDQKSYRYQDNAGTADIFLPQRQQIDSQDNSVVAVIGHRDSVTTTTTGFDISPRRSGNAELRIGIQTGAMDLQIAGMPLHSPVVQRLAIPAERMVRRNFCNRIVSILDQLAKKAQLPTSSPLVADLFFVIRDYAQQSPADPFVDIVMALHDALAANDFWVSATMAQYLGAIKILVQLGSRPNLSENNIASAIEDMENLGLDTTPFGMTKIMD